MRCFCPLSLFVSFCTVLYSTQISFFCYEQNMITALFLVCPFMCERLCERILFKINILRLTVLHSLVFTQVLLNNMLQKIYKFNCTSNQEVKQHTFWIVSCLCIILFPFYKIVVAKIRLKTWASLVLTLSVKPRVTIAA